MEGRSCLLKAVFRRPSDARLWHYLSRYLLTSRDEENEAGPLSAHAAEVALALRPTVSAHARLLGEVRHLPSVILPECCVRDVGRWEMGRFSIR